MLNVDSVTRSGQESIAQGLPWVITPTRISSEGTTRHGDKQLGTFEPDRVRISSPFGARRLYHLTQGKPWAKLSCPFGAGLSGRVTGAKRIPARSKGPNSSSPNLCLL
jgi:hypothetical protein